MLCRPRACLPAEHEKEPGAAPAKRPRGGDGGPDGRGGGGGGPGGPPLLGSPEKKKRKAHLHNNNPQGASFLLTSEYAPPLNPSADHLIAANPFDDNYQSVSYKTLPIGNPYFASPSYPAFGGGFNTFRMPPHMLSRMASPPYRATYPLRNQPIPQSPVGFAFNQPPAIHFGPQENTSFENHPSYSASLHQNHSFPVQPHLRPNPGENFGHMPSHNATTQMAHPMPAVRFGPGSHTHFSSSPMEASHYYAPFLPNHSSQPRPSQKPGANKHKSIAALQHQLSPDNTTSTGKAEVNAENPKLSVHLEGVLPKNAGNNLDSSLVNGASHEQELVEVVPAEQGSKTSLHPSQHGGNPPSEPVYLCGICTHEVNEDQDAIVCEASCHKWFHRICTGMTESAYGLLTAEASAVWGCDTCMADKDIQLMRTSETVGQQQGLGADL